MSSDAEASAIAELDNMIAFIARKFPRSVVLGFEDLMQIGRIGALKAHRTFDPSRQVLRKTWFYICVAGEMKDAHRSLNHVRGKDGELTGPGADVTFARIVSNALPSGRDFRRAVEARIDATKLLNNLKLNPRAAEVIQRRFFEGLTQKETGARVGLSGMGVFWSEAATLAKLRRAAA